MYEGPTALHVDQFYKIHEDISSIAGDIKKLDQVLFDEISLNPDKCIKNIKQGKFI